MRGSKAAALLLLLFFSLRRKMEQWQYWYEQYTSIVRTVDTVGILGGAIGVFLHAAAGAGAGAGAVFLVLLPFPRGAAQIDKQSKANPQTTTPPPAAVCLFFLLVLSLPTTTRTPRLSIAQLTELNTFCLELD
jgi:hypothetical protein